MVWIVGFCLVIWNFLQSTAAERGEKRRGVSPNDLGVPMLWRKKKKLAEIQPVVKLEKSM